MKAKKSMVISATVLSLTFLLSACGSNQASNSSTSGSTAVQNPEVQTSETQSSESAPAISGNSSTGGRLKITLNGEQVVTAELVDSLATEEFLEQLPFTISMHEHLNRQKEVYLPFKLSEENQQNTVHEYEVGDIVYWHPGPTMGIFTSHDGRSISSGVEILARLDEEGVAAFASYPDDVEVLFEYEQDNTQTDSQSITEGERQLTITLDDTVTIQAAFLDSPAANAFSEHLPLTLNMTDYLGREKHAGLNFTIADSDLLNIQTPYEIGDIIYYPPGPTLAMFYDHDGREISAGMEVIARLDDTGIETMATYPDAVKVTIELSK